MNGNELAVEPQAEPIDLAPGDEPQAQAEGDNIKVTAVPADEPAAPEGEEPEPAKEPETVDQEPDTTPEIDKKIEKLEKQLGYEMRQRKKLEKQLSRQRLQPEDDLAAPNEEDFETYADYDQARIQYEVKKGIHEYQQQQEHQSADLDLGEYMTEIFESGKERYSDFITKVDKTHNPTLPISEQMLRVMQQNEMENPESIIYYLSNNVQECASISRMSPVQQARALTKIENKVAKGIKNAPVAAVKKVTRAPEPIKPGGSAGVVTKDPSEMSQKEYEAWRSKGGGA